MRKYKCLSKIDFRHGCYKLVPIGDEEKYLVMRWRNEQIKNLRQKQPLNKEQQEIYYSTVVANLFIEEKPQQLLFSLLENDIFIGYCGLVHIDWESKNAEVSFLIETKLSIDEEQWADKFSNCVEILKKIAKDELGFVKLYTYGYEVEPYVFKFKVMLNFNFVEEARLKNHIRIDDKFHDVLIHSYFL